MKVWRKYINEIAREGELRAEEITEVRVRSAKLTSPLFEGGERERERERETNRERERERERD